MKPLPLRLLKKHYGIQQNALNEIAELIAMCDGDWAPGDLIEKIESVADAARQFDLLNPHSNEAAQAWVESLEYLEPRCELPPVVIEVDA
jgi:hypothetical protein